MSVKRDAPAIDQFHDPSLSKWERLLQNKDDKKVWAAINWHGELLDSQLGPSQNASTSPADHQFREFFESTLNDDCAQLNSEEYHTDVHVPVLDNPFSPIEVSDKLDDLDSNKACGIDGVSPGVFRMLPDEWIIIVTLILNNIFINALYPSSWATAKMFMIYKKGCRLLPSNYRGISIINCLAKVYDMILCGRLQQWFRPYREQAGAQVGRGCLEHITTLRLIIDFAKKKRIKLFVIFVDFAQAYDKVPRAVLFSILKRLGCGATMLLSLVAMYKVTKSVIGTAVIAASVGVRQGSPTSCLLFVLFVNDMIKLYKENCHLDGFLRWLHLLVFMDDTVILSTSRQGSNEKLNY